ncbi:MAG TPA: GNAT family N-acetyltransferase [Aliicoccus persicus]|uniref:GNAT family N-acetyltransferase n=1 Tax=Aliicoccus persicus TaxID=930138 RepID=A0A921JDC8_9STAP|nr:GNAT family N-acetyltransferase [Aliicoccus persicus]
MIQFRTIDEDNFYDVIGMELENDDFVASNVYSLAEAWLSKGDMMPYAIYNEETLVGFIMLEKNYKDGGLGILRMMIAEEHQNKGFGSKCIEHVLQNPEYREAYDFSYIYLVPENERANFVYKRAGFYDTGEIEEGELVFRYDF